MLIMLNMMDLTIGRRLPTPRSSTPPIPSDDRPAQRCRKHPPGRPGIHDLPLSTKHHRQDLPITSPRPNDPGIDRTREPRRRDHRPPQIHPTSRRFLRWLIPGFPGPQQLLRDLRPWRRIRVVQDPASQSVVVDHRHHLGCIPTRVRQPRILHPQRCRQRGDHRIDLTTIPLLRPLRPRHHINTEHPTIVSGCTGGSSSRRTLALTVLVAAARPGRLGRLGVVEQAEQVLIPPRTTGLRRNIGPLRGRFTRALLVLPGPRVSAGRGHGLEDLMLRLSQEQVPEEQPILLPHKPGTPPLIHHPHR